MFDKKKKDKVEIAAKKEIEKFDKFRGSIKLCKGHILFEVNIKTLEIEPAEIENTVSVKYDKQRMPVYHKKAKMKQDCIYISALNIKNVERKLIKAGIAVRKES